MVVAVDVGNGLAVLRARQSNYDARYRRAIARVSHPAADFAEGPGRSIVTNNKNCAGAAREIVETAVGGDEKIDRAGGAGRKCDGRACRRIKAANPAGAKLCLEILADIVAGKVYGSWIVESSTRNRTASRR